MTALSNQITKAIVAISKANALMSVAMDASEIRLLLKLKKQARKLRAQSALLDLASMRAKDVALKYKLSLNKVIAIEQASRLYNNETSFVQAEMLEPVQTPPALCGKMGD